MGSRDKDPDQKEENKYGDQDADLLKFIPIHYFCFGILVKPQRHGGHREFRLNDFEISVPSVVN